MTINDVLNKCLSGQFQLHVVCDDHEVLAGICTRVGEFGKFHVLCMGGRNLTSWGGSLKYYMITMAKTKNCHVIGGYGRIGWLRALNITPRKLFSWELDL